MTRLMRCLYCGLLQDEPAGTKSCSRCGGGLEYENLPPLGKGGSYLQVQMELDQIAAPAGQNVERYLLITIQSPDQVPLADAAPPGKPRPPLHFAAVLDISGSMQGEKISQAKEAVRQAVRFLHAGDIFALVTFANEVHSAIEPVEVDGNTFSEVESVLQKIQAGGMTALSGGLEKGLEKALKRKQDNNLVLLLSDGQANVGETDLEKVGQLAYHAHQKGLLVSTLGVGLDYNEALMSEIATQGGGRFYHILNPNKIPAFVAGELGEVASLAAREAAIRLAIPHAATLVPLSAAYPIQQAGEEATVSIGDIPCGIELEIPIRLAILAQAVNSKLSLEGVLEFRSPAGHGNSLPVNRVTVRFVEPGGFQLREGIVQPVAERVFAQMKAASVLNVSRVRAVGRQNVGEKTDSAIASLQAYAHLLGDDRADEEMNAVKLEFNALTASPMAAKRVVSDAHRTLRATKDFDH